MNKKTILILVISAAVILALIWFFSKRNKKPGNTTTGSEAGETPNNNNNNNQPLPELECVNPSSYTDTGWPLKLGNENNMVKLLQVKINEKHSAGLTEDGKFGCETQQALKQYYGKTSIQSALELYNTIF
jgi:hypothetical protein